MTIEVEHAEHFAGVRDLLVAAFDGVDEAGLVEELRAQGLVVAAFIARDEAGIAGAVMYSAIEVICDGRSVSAAALAPLAVRSDRRKQGVGAVLVESGLAACRGFGCGVAVVLGDPRYYGRFGFSAEAARRFSCPFSGPALQVLELVPGALGQGQGRIQYSRPFNRFC